MKCKNPRCEKESAPQRWYCTRSCAPYGHFAGESRTPSVKRTKRFYAQAASGEALEVSLDEPKQPPFPKWHQNVRNGPGKIKETTMDEIPKPFVPKLASTGTVDPKNGAKHNLRKEWTTPKNMSNIDVTKRESTMQSTGLTDCGSSMKIDEKETLPAVLTKPSVNSEEVRSHSLNLINDSAKRLSELMNSEKLTPIEVCSCANQLHKLIRLNLDIVRQFQK